MVGRWNEDIMKMKSPWNFFLGWPIFMIFPIFSCTFRILSEYFPKPTLCHHYKSLYNHIIITIISLYNHYAHTISYYAHTSMWIQCGRCNADPITLLDMIWTWPFGAANWLCKCMCRLGHESQSAVASPLSRKIRNCYSPGPTGSLALCACSTMPATITK